MSSPQSPEHSWELLDRRDARRRAAWFRWETGRICSVVRPGDTVLELDAATSALAVAVADPAGWVFIGERRAEGLAALTRTLEVVRPPNVTIGPLETIRRWCPVADVVIMADWSPASDDPDAELSDFLTISDRWLVLTGWRRAALGVDGDTHGGYPLELALAYARQHDLDARLWSVPDAHGRDRTVVIVPGNAARPTIST